MTDINLIRERVCEHIHDGYTDKAVFNNADIVWVEGYQEWLLVATDPETGNQYWRGTENNAAKLLHYISDEDVRDFYEEELAECYDEDTNKEATYEWFMSLDKTAQSEWLSKVRSHDNPFFQTDQDIIDSLPKDTA